MFGTRKGELSSSPEIYEDGLLPPTLNDSRPQPIDEDEPTTQPALDYTTEPTTLSAELRQIHPAPRQRTTMDQRRSAW